MEFNVVEWGYDTIHNSWRVFRPEGWLEHLDMMFHSAWAVHTGVCMHSVLMCHAVMAFIMRNYWLLLSNFLFASPQYTSFLPAKWVHFLHSELAMAESLPTRTVPSALVQVSSTPTRLIMHSPDSAIYCILPHQGNQPPLSPSVYIQGKQTVQPGYLYDAQFC
jgi:hypothetical protein